MAEAKTGSRGLSASHTAAKPMGCGHSKDSSGRGRAGKGPPDAGLQEEFEHIKLLGSGGTGETHLYKTRRSGELVAIKLVPRPLPRVLHESILREITVRPALHAGNPAPRASRDDALPRGRTC